MDVVVTVPKKLWTDWLAEGSRAGEPPEDPNQGFDFSVPSRPKIERGERVYVVAHGRLRGYARLVSIERDDRTYFLVRKAGAVAVTIADTIPGFRGWRYRWWDPSIEIPFPEWKTP